MGDNGMQIFQNLMMANYMDIFMKL